MGQFEKNEVLIHTPDAEVNGYLNLLSDSLNGPKGIVVFAHGSGSGRHSTRNQQVASFFHDHALATLLIDLLTPEEEAIDEETRELRFNIPFLAKRLNHVTQWLLKNTETAHLPVGYIGSSTGAAAALVAAAENRQNIAAVVSRGGRPDLAGSALKRVRAPTLLIVGGHDFEVLELNKLALDVLQVEKRLSIVPGATHLFEEAGTLQQASVLACQWFLQWLVKSKTSP